MKKKKLLFLCARKTCGAIVEKYANDARHKLMRDHFVWTGTKKGWVAKNVDEDRRTKVTQKEEYRDPVSAIVFSSFGW